MATINAPGSDARLLGNLPDCGGSAWLLIASLVPGVGAALDAAGNAPHISYQPSPREEEDLALKLSITTTAPPHTPVDYRFDVGTHVLPWPGSLSLRGGSGQWSLEARLVPYRGSNHRPYTRWLRAYLNGTAGIPATLAVPAWHQWLAASEDILVIDAYAHTVLATHVPIAMPGQGTYSIRSAAYLYTGVDF